MHEGGERSVVVGVKSANCVETRCDDKVGLNVVSALLFHCFKQSIIRFVIPTSDRYNPHNPLGTFPLEQQGQIVEIGLGQKLRASLSTRVNAPRLVCAFAMLMLFGVVCIVVANCVAG
jgi:hypothetical protein